MRGAHHQISYTTVHKATAGLPLLRTKYVASYIIMSRTACGASVVKL